MNPLRGLMRGNIESYDANFNVSLNRGLMAFNEPVREFSPLLLKPALWLDASDQSTLVTDGAASFTSASSQYLSCASNSTLQTGNVSYWIGFWVKSIVGGNQNFASKGASGAAGYEWKVQTQSNNTFRFQALSSNAASADSVTSGTATFTNWNFLLCYKDVGGNVGIILNGNSPVTTSQTVTQVAGTSALELGKYLTGYFDGQLDSVVFGKPSNGWLASNAVALAAYLYNSGNGRRSSDFINSSLYSGSGAVSWWDLHERNGTRKDRIGTNDLTDNNSVGYAAGIASGAVQYDGDPVRQWSDKSGNARHLIAQSDASRPTYKTKVQHDKDVLSFDGIDDYLEATFSQAQPCSVFVVASHNAPITNSIDYYLVDDKGITNYQVIKYRGNGLAVRLDSNYSMFDIAKAPEKNTFAVISVLFNGTTSQHSSNLWINGSPKGPKNGGNTYTTTGFRIGSRGGTIGNYFNGQVAEVIIIKPSSGILSDFNRRQVEEYLGQKWGISLS
jgi:hypothetical protein